MEAQSEQLKMVNHTDVVKRFIEKFDLGYNTCNRLDIAFLLECIANMEEDPEFKLEQIEAEIMAVTDERERYIKIYDIVNDYILKYIEKNIQDRKEREQSIQLYKTTAEESIGMMRHPDCSFSNLKTDIQERGYISVPLEFVPEWGKVLLYMEHQAK
jgi:hypothetical protein